MIVPMSERTLCVDAPVIAPSMLKCDFANLLSEVKRLEVAGAQLLHWDVMDAHFVPNLSYGAMVLQSVRPHTNLFFDAHLMMADPARYLDDYVKAGCDAITIHIEAVPEPGPVLARIRAAGIKAGLAINPQTPVEAIEANLSDCDLVLVMSVQPGFGGQAFIPDVLGKVRALRSKVSPGTWISIDGGIGPATIGEAAEAGVQLYVAGSSIFDHSDYAAAMRDMEGRALSRWSMASPRTSGA